MRFLSLTLISLLSACSHATADKNPAANSADMRGTIQISFETAEFIRQGQTYYLNDTHGVLSDLIKREREKSKAFLVRKDICLNGYIQTKAQNGNNGFGALGKYGQAVFVQKLC